MIEKFVKKIPRSAGEGIWEGFLLRTRGIFRDAAVVHLGEESRRGRPETPRKKR